MKLASLFSGGKDSCYALHLARKAGHEIACLLTVISENEESFMFHTPNTRWTEKQAEAIGIPLLTQSTKGEKEEELKDLAALLARAKKEFAIEGVVTGALASSYQKERVERVCSELGLAALSPLWGREQVSYLRELVGAGFDVIIIGVFAEPLGEGWLGRRLDGKAIDELASLRKSHGLNPAGEGGELETFVTWAPGWKARLVIEKAEKSYRNYAGTLTILKLRLEKE